VIDIPTGSAATTGQTGALPFTGSHETGLLLAGLGLVAAGGAALAFGRRARTT